jgi:hypothetical protein
MRAIIASFAALLLTAPAAAASFVTYAQFNRETLTDVDYIGGALSSLTLGDTLVDFEILSNGPVGLYSVTMSGEATSSEPFLEVGPFGIQGGFAGEIRFLDGGTNYLTVSFSNAVLTGTLGGSSGSFLASSPSSDFVVTSDILDLSAFVLHSFSISFSGLTPPFDGETSANRASLTGGFAGAVPEPASWALLIAGFGMVGMAARRRRQGLAQA